MTAPSNFTTLDVWNTTLSGEPVQVVGNRSAGHQVTGSTMQPERGDDYTQPMTPNKRRQYEAMPSPGGGGDYGGASYTGGGIAVEGPIPVTSSAAPPAQYMAARDANAFAQYAQKPKTTHLRIEPPQMADTLVSLLGAQQTTQTALWVLVGLGALILIVLLILCCKKTSPALPSYAM